MVSKIIGLILLLMATSCMQLRRGSDVSDDFAYGLGPNELRAIQLLKVISGFQSSYCTAAFVAHDTAIMPAHCIKAASLAGGQGGISARAADGSDIPALEHYLVGNLITRIDSGVWQSRALIDMAIVVFPENTSTKIGISRPTDVKKLAASAAQEGKKIYFLGFGVDVQANQYRLAQADEVLTKREDGYFVSKVPTLSQDENPPENLVNIDWVGVGSLVLDENMRLVGIVSSIETLRVAGTGGQQRFAVITDLQSARAYQLYRNAILCSPDRKRCASKFENSGIDQKSSVVAAQYANREGRRCAVELKTTIAADKQTILALELSGISDDCTKYKTVFNNCVDNECSSSETCETLTLQPAGFNLISLGKTYSFGLLESVPKREFDVDIPEVAIKSLSGCFRSSIKEVGTSYCSKKGEKWYYFDDEADFFSAKNLCEKYEYKMPSYPIALDLAGKDSVLHSPVWTTDLAPSDAAQQSVAPLRKLFNARSGHEFGKADNHFQSGVMCYCPRSK